MLAAGGEASRVRPTVLRARRTHRSSTDATRCPGAAGLAYFVNDCIDTRSQWLANPSFLLHHLLGATMAGGAMLGAHAAPVAPFIIMAEGSTLFLNPMQAR